MGKPKNRRGNMKKLYSCLVACFAALLLAFPLLGIKTAAACGDKAQNGSKKSDASR